MTEQTKQLQFYLGYFQAPQNPHMDDESQNYMWLSAQGSLAQSRLADVIERFVLEQDSWLAIAQKISQLQAKVEILQKEVSGTAQVFVESATSLHERMQDIEGRMDISGMNQGDFNGALEKLCADVDLLLGRGAGEQSESPDPFLPELTEEEEDRLHKR